MFILEKSWKDYSIVAFDTETSGAYPLDSEIVEFGAVKWKDGQEVGRLQMLLKPSEPMTQFIIGIHGITNEMVADAPKMSEKINEIHSFLDGSIIVAHHAPFDLGFLRVDFEKNKMSSPNTLNLCTSLLARKLIHETVNHKLQTLVKYFNINGGQAHRAYDDASACLQVAFECFRRLEGNSSLANILEIQGKNLDWSNYDLLSLPPSSLQKISQAIAQRKKIDIVYQGGTAGIGSRRITPMGIVRNPDGDYVMALCHRDGVQKRFYISKIKEMEVEL